MTDLDRLEMELAGMRLRRSLRVIERTVALEALRELLEAQVAREGRRPRASSPARARSRSPKPSGEAPPGGTGAA